MMHLLQIHEPGQTPNPHAEDSVAVGIDLGTTHSVVAFSHAGKAEVLRNIHGHALVPSIVHYDEQGAAHVGFAAKAEWEKGHPRAVASIKRHMNEAAKPLHLDKTPVELSAEILREMKHIAERALGKAVSKAVITVPAYFDDTARTATRDAAHLAGLEVLRLINEPTAAALTYGLENDVEGIYAIYDLGGGTFDVSLLKLEKGVFQVLATAGDTQLGGDDMDVAIQNLINEHPLRLRGGIKGGEANHVIIPPLISPPPAGGANISARTIKERLSTEQEVEGITREAYEALITPLVDRTIEICKFALADARLTPKDIKGVVLVGGATRTPLVRRRVEEFFGKTPLIDMNPDEVVALGAAIQAEALTCGGEHLLLDVVPLSLGLETMGGLTEKLIYRNSPIPCSVTQEFTTYQDGQQGMQIHVVQGEREMVAHNRSLAKFELKNIPPLPAGIARIAVTFTVDADGLLTVSAEEKTTGIKQRVEVKPSYGLDAEAMMRMLQESMEHAKEDIMERMLIEAKTDAERSIIEIESAMKQDGDLLEEAERKLIGLQIGYLREAIQDSDRERIDVEVGQLGRVATSFAERRMNTQIANALKGKAIKIL